MEIKAKKKTLRVWLDDQNFKDVRFPTAGELNEFGKKKDDSLDSTIEFLDLLGLPKNDALNLDADTLIEVVKALTPKAEKKS